MFKTCYGSVQFLLTFKKKRQTFIYLNSKFSSGYSRSQLYLKGFSHYPVRGQISFLGIKQKLKYLCLKQCRLNSWRVSKCLPFLSQVIIILSCKNALHSAEKVTYSEMAPTSPVSAFTSFQTLRTFKSTFTSPTSLFAFQSISIK